MPVTITGSNTPTAGGVTYGDGATYANTAAGTSGQVLLSNGASAPTWGTAGAATTATNLAGGSNGTIPYQSASGTTQMLAVGTSGQVLKSNGAAAPTWITPSSGALVFISSVTASNSATVSFTSLSSTYDVYMVELVNLVTVNAELQMRMSTNNGSSYDTTNYRFSSIGGVNTSSAAEVDSLTGNASLIRLMCNNTGSISGTASHGGMSGFVYVVNPAASNFTRVMFQESHAVNANHPHQPKNNCLPSYRLSQQKLTHWGNTCHQQSMPTTA
jgi:hypothetical protein